MAERLLAGKQRPTAIFCENDEMAAGAYRAARRAGGLDLPRELSIVGYDDSPLASRLWPPLTSVRRDTRDTGRIAAAMLTRPADAPSPPAACGHTLSSGIPASPLCDRARALKSIGGRLWTDTGYQDR